MKVLVSTPQLYNSRPQSGVEGSQQQQGASKDANQVLLGKLADKIPGMSAEKLSGLEAEDFTPDKVAGRISDFVAQGLEAARSRGASEERLTEMYNAAVKGVEKGFAEAREILDELDMLNGGIAAQIDETEQLRIFEKGVSSKAKEGRGIGLHLVKNLLDNLGGTVTVEPASQIGSRFIVYIPKQREQRSVQAE